MRRHYDHARLEPQRRVLRWLITHIGFRTLVKFERVEGVENLPAAGPAILMINHIAFVDPIVVLGCLPRNVVPMAKIEVYRYPIWGVFPWLWQVIAVRRGEVDREALRRAQEVLEAGEVVLMAPEGTRSPALRRGKEGVAYLGARTGSRVIPVAVEGTEGFPSISPRRWRQPGVVVRLGRPFRFREAGERVGRERLRQMTDEAMYVLAAMLPERRRGVYADLSRARTETLDFA
ncbi:MAG: lysophospholipid acyltransferase family protein [Chloroflexota bacterium]